MAGVLNIGDSASGFFDSIVDTTTKVFDWVEDNPTVSGAIAGGASALLSYRAQRRQQEFERDLRREDREYQSQFGGASTTKAGQQKQDYLTNTQGRLTGQKGLTQNTKAKSNTMAGQFYQ